MRRHVLIVHLLDLVSEHLHLLLPVTLHLPPPTIGTGTKLAMLLLRVGGLTRPCCTV